MRNEHWLRRQRGMIALLATKGRFISPRGACFSTITFSSPEESRLVAHQSKLALLSIDNAKVMNRKFANRLNSKFVKVLFVTA